MNETHPVLKAARIVGSQSAIAAQLGLKKQNVYQWTLPGRKVPAEHCPLIERMTEGKVRCEELRPDVDWAYIRASPDAAAPAINVNPVPGGAVLEPH